MAPEDQPLPQEPSSSQLSPAVAPEPPVLFVDQDPVETRVLRKLLLGDNGLRAGWSVLCFLILYLLVAAVTGAVFFRLHLVSMKGGFTASEAFWGETISFLGMTAAAAVVALIERRRGNLLAYNLSGPHRLFNFIFGLASGFAALSALIAALAWGGWLTFGPVALSGVAVYKFAALWGLAFLTVGFVEEGTFRCFLQFTLTRGVNFWWAAGIIALVCGELLWRGKGNGIWGVYIIAALGLIPCLLLQVFKARSAGFWQAAWVTTTLFGFVHTGNNGENPIGIFAAAFVGFAFCVSIWATGSAWWAIGCHAAWDWAETYFYGAADSGNVATGHLLTTNPAGNAFWSGGTAGPEGSVLVIAVVALMILLLALFGLRRQRSLPAAAPPVLGEPATD
jgi:membrane protease YdiL (CAAX protease family)